MHVSPNYLSSLFTRETGQSFKEHLIQIRMNKAKELLLTSSAKVQEIALAVGYTDTHYFSYSTKRYFGLSPRQIREAAQKGVPHYDSGQTPPLASRHLFDLFSLVYFYSRH